MFFFIVKTLCKISEAYNNPFGEKSNRIGGTKERENTVNRDIVKRLTKMNVIVQKTWDKREIQLLPSIFINKEMLEEVDLSGNEAGEKQGTLGSCVK